MEIISHTEGISIQEAAEAYLNRLRQLGRSPATQKAYGQGLKIFLSILEENLVDISGPVSQLNVETYDWLLTGLENHSAASKQLYISAVTNFFEYITARELSTLNFNQILSLRKSANRRRAAAPKFPQFSAENIQKVLDYAEKLPQKPAEDEEERLRYYRDRALVLVLADTGLRIHEACALTRGQIDWNEGRAIIVGKGNKEALIRFTTRSLKALREYLHERMKIDGSLGKPLHTLPIFMRHNRPIGPKSKNSQTRPISTETGRDIVEKLVNEALGPEAAGSITPHSFRHYFVTIILKRTGNLRITQELARHSNIATTVRYTHLTNAELDQAYSEALEDE